MNQTDNRASQPVSDLDETHEVAIYGSDGDEITILELSHQEFLDTQQKAFQLYYTALILKACGVVDKAVDTIRQNLDEIISMTENDWPEIARMIEQTKSAMGDLELVLRHYRVAHPNL